MTSCHAVPTKHYKPVLLRATLSVSFFIGAKAFCCADRRLRAGIERVGVSKWFLRHPRFLRKFDLIADDPCVDQGGGADFSVYGACGGFEQDVRLVTAPALVPVKLPVQPDRADAGRLLLHFCAPEGHGMVFRKRAVDAEREVCSGDNLPHRTVMEEKPL